MSSGRLVLTRRFSLGEISLTRRLAAGRYRVASWTRSCSGSCDHLDPPSNSCARVIRVLGGKTRRATLVTEVGQNCRIAL